MDCGLDVSEEASEQESILDKLGCDDQLLLDISDTASEVDDVHETEHDSYDSDGFSKDPLSSDVSDYRYDTVSIKMNKISFSGIKREKLAAFH